MGQPPDGRGRVHQEPGPDQITAPTALPAYSTPTMVGRTYLDPGDRLSGRIDPPVPVVVLARWGPGGGPRNVLVEYPDGHQAVIPFPRRLRRVEALPERPAADKARLSPSGCARCARRDRDRRRRQAVREAPEIAASARRLIEALGRRVAGGDPDGLRLLADLRDAIGRAEQVAVAGLRAQGHSDATLGAELGVSRQAVRQRWPRALDVPEVRP
jgi:hypothetical protein